MSPIERSTMRKVYWRILPFTGLLYFICYLDRINVGFAALTMRQEMGFTAAAWALGAGAFFWGYFLLEVPSNVLLDKLGARLWIARIMVTWGILSGATAFVTGETSFMIVRFLLGLAEAGFFPGMILYFTYWFPARYRGRIVAGFMTAVPISIALGAPISTSLLELDGVLGLAGWKWLFLIEAVPAVVLGVVVYFCMTDKPILARWLTPEEQNWLTDELARERREIEAVRTYSWVQSLINPRVLALAVVYFGIAGCSLGLVLFLPQMLKQLGTTNFWTGFTAAIPYVVGTMGMIALGKLTDRTGERRWNCVFACSCAAVGLAFAAFFSHSFWSLAGFSLATVGIYGMKPSFWPMPSLFLSGTAAAAGIAWINALGNLSGSVATWMIGEIKDRTGSFEGGLYGLAAFAAVSVVFVMIAAPSQKRRAEIPSTIAGVPAE